MSLHKEKVNKESKDETVTHLDGEEGETKQVESKCRAVCRSNNGGISCCKILLVDIRKPDKPYKLCRVYAIVNDQSNRSLLSSELVDNSDQIVKKKNITFQPAVVTEKPISVEESLDWS